MNIIDPSSISEPSDEANNRIDPQKKSSRAKILMSLFPLLSCYFFKNLFTLFFSPISSYILTSFLSMYLHIIYDMSSY
jgi:hypothetical protein